MRFAGLFLKPAAPQVPASHSFVVFIVCAAPKTRRPAMQRFLSGSLFAVLTMCTFAASAQDYVFEGPWHTTNRKLDGIMTCAVTDLGNEKWKGRFYGVWQGVPFDYTVAFAGKPSELKGTATIDGAHY